MKSNYRGAREILGRGFFATQQIRFYYSYNGNHCL